MPVQRLPRYELLLKSLLGFTNPEHEDYQTLVSANGEIKKVNQYINDRQREDDEKDSIIQLLLAQRGRGIGKKSNVTDTDVDGYLKVSIMNATNLIPIFSNKSCNALAEVHFGKKVFATHVVRKDNSPTWDEEFVLQVPIQTSSAFPTTFTIIVWDYDRLRPKEMIGSIIFNTTEFVNNMAKQQRSVSLGLSPKCEKRKKKQPSPEIQLSFIYRKADEWGAV